MPQKKIDKYTINFQNLLGKGSFAEVYLCVDQQTKAEYAVKIVSKSKIQQDQYLMNALRHELAIHNNLRHQNIVKFVEVFETSKNFYIIQQYCNGGNIRNFLTQYKRFEEIDAIQCLESVCRSFEQLLKNAVLHRDIKPENILIKDGVIKLGDFGLSKKVQTQRQLSETVVGTPRYMSPQILQALKYSSKCDIWSLGILFYEMLYGVHPWVGNTQLAMINNINTQPLKFPKKPEISENARDFIERALKIEQSDRITWIQIFEHALFQNRLKKIATLWRQGYVNAAQKLDRLRPKVSSQQLTGVFFRFESNTLNFNSFSQVIKWLINQSVKGEVSDFQIAIMYEMFDKDLNGVIDLEQFVGEFQVCDPRILRLLKILIEKQFSFKSLQSRDLFYTESSIILQEHCGDNIQTTDKQFIINGGYKIVSNILLQ